MASFRTCPFCARTMTVVLSGNDTHWRCELCPHHSPFNDVETLIASGNGGAAPPHGATLYQQYERIVGQDPTANKIYGNCTQCKKQTVMTLAFLGEDEQTLYGCADRKSVV